MDVDDLLFELARPYRALRYHLVGWFIRKYVLKNYLLGPLPPDGKWHDICDLMLNANFQALVDYVDYELSEMYRFCYNEKHPLLPRRDPVKGLLYLNEMAQLQDSTIASKGPESPKAHQQLLDLYKWWTVQRPLILGAIKALYDELPEIDVDEWLQAMREGREKYSPEYKAKMAHINRLEAKMGKAEDKNLALLISLRHHLWT